MTNQQPGGKIYLPPLDTTASWDVWLHTRVAALNLRRLLALGLHHRHGTWAIA